MVKNTKTWISWERNITFPKNKKVHNLCPSWHILLVVAKNLHRKYTETGTYTKIRWKKSNVFVSKLARKWIYYVICCMAFWHTQKMDFPCYILYGLLTPKSTLSRKWIYHVICCMAFWHTQIYRVAIYYNMDKLRVFFIGNYLNLALQTESRLKYVCHF